MKSFLMSFFLIEFILFNISYSFGQVAINIDGSLPAGSAMLDVKSDSKGFLPPRMTTAQISAIAIPDNGLIVFNTDNGKIYVFVSMFNAWQEISYGPNTINPPIISGDPLIDIRDGKIYNTLHIGTQFWMAQNLNIGTMINGSTEQSDNGIIEKYSYNNLESNSDTYGGLYQWAEAVQYINGATNYAHWDSIPTTNVQGICPSGWHLPTDAEMCQLESFLDSIVACEGYGWIGVDVGGKMKDVNSVYWSSPNTGANNESLFTALPSGINFINYGFDLLGNYTYFWTASPGWSNSSAISRFLSYDDARINRSDPGKINGCSVRCCKD